MAAIPAEPGTLPLVHLLGVACIIVRVQQECLAAVKTMYGRSRCRVVGRGAMGAVSHYSVRSLAASAAQQVSQYLSIGLGAAVAKHLDNVLGDNLQHKPWCLSAGHLEQAMLSQPDCHGQGARGLSRTRPRKADGSDALSSYVRPEHT
jgi:hypothetical protein